MRQTTLIIFALLLSLQFSFAQAPKIKHFGFYAGYNTNSINQGALNELTRLWNNSHRNEMTISNYAEFQRMGGLSGGLISYYKTFFADAGFDIRRNTLYGRFKDVVGQFQSQRLSMDAFHIGVGANLSSGKDKVMITPGASLGIGRIEIREGAYRTLDDKLIPLTQKRPTAAVDNSKSMSILNAFASVYVNFTIGSLNGKRLPKFIIQPYLTIPINKTDLSAAYYPTSNRLYNSDLKGRLQFWGCKFAVAF